LGRFSVRGFKGHLSKKEKKRDRYHGIFFLDCLRFSGLILENIFIVFLGSSCEKRPKTRFKKKTKGKDDRKKVFFSQLFRPKVFDMDFPKKVLNGVFELPLLRNAQKRHKKTHTHTHTHTHKTQPKKEGGAVVPHLVFISARYTPLSKKQS
jgi:hypothetical protein